MTVERYATARDLFEAARTAAQELERISTQREMLAMRRGYRSPSLSPMGAAPRTDANGTDASNALMDFEALMAERSESDIELLDYASGVLYGRNGRGGLSSAMGGIYADILCWRYLMACTWDVTAAANRVDDRTARIYADSALAAVDECGLMHLDAP